MKCSWYFFCHVSDVWVAMSEKLCPKTNFNIFFWPTMGDITHQSLTFSSLPIILSDIFISTTSRLKCCVVCCTVEGAKEMLRKHFNFFPQSGEVLSTAHSQDGRSFHYLNNIISIFEHAGHPPKIGLFEGCPEISVFAKKDRHRTMTVQASHLLSCLCLHCEKFAFLAQKWKEAK